MSSFGQVTASWTGTFLGGGHSVVASVHYAQFVFLCGAGSLLCSCCATILIADGVLSADDYLVCKVMWTYAAIWVELNLYLVRPDVVSFSRRWHCSACLHAQATTWQPQNAHPGQSSSLTLLACGVGINMISTLSLLILTYNISLTEVSLMMG